MLCVSSCESVVQPLSYVSEIWFVWLTVGLSSAVGMLTLLPVQFVALVMKQGAATKNFSQSQLHGNIGGADVLIG